jgi:cobalt/nickel transport system permease protein
MHISEGVLSGPVLLAGGALSLAGTAVGLARIDYDRLMTVAILAAAFFTASLVHVPVGPANAHLVMNGLVGCILGWAAFPAILAGLVLQAALFQFGGFTSLGVNTLNMALPAVLCFYLFRTLAVRVARPRLAGLVCGAAGVFLAGVLTALALAASEEGFAAAAGMLLAAHLPVMVVEGLVTAGTVAFLARVRPELLAFADRREERGGQGA